MERKPLITIFTTMRRKLLFTARGISGDDADDALQEAFCRLWTLPKIPDEESQVARLATTTVKNISIDYQRKVARQRETDIAELPEMSDNSATTGQQEQFLTVKKIIENHLTEVQQRALWMRDYEDYSFAEIAEELETTEANARQTVSRARKTVRDIYKSIRI